LAILIGGDVITEECHMPRGLFKKNMPFQMDKKSKFKKFSSDEKRIHNPLLGIEIHAKIINSYKNKNN
jgi:hypothetical protein